MGDFSNDQIFSICRRSISWNGTIAAKADAGFELKLIPVPKRKGRAVILMIAAKSRNFTESGNCPNSTLSHLSRQHRKLWEGSFIDYLPHQRNFNLFKKTKATKSTPRLRIIRESPIFNAIRKKKTKDKDKTPERSRCDRRPN